MADFPTWRKGRRTELSGAGLVDGRIRL